MNRGHLRTKNRIVFTHLWCENSLFNAGWYDPAFFVLLFLRPDRCNQGTDADTGGSQVVDFINLQTGIDLAGSRQDIIYLICSNGIQTTSERIQLDQIQKIYSFYIIGSCIQTAVIHPLVTDNQRTFRLMQMRDRVFCQYCNAIRSNQFRNTMVDLVINVIRTTCKNDTVFAMFFQPCNGFFTFFVHGLTDPGQFRPSQFCSFFYFGSRNFREGFDQLRSYRIYAGKCHKWIAEINVFTAQLFHVILDIFRIRGNDRAVVMVIGIREFISLIWNRRVENKMNTLLNQPFNMSVSQLGRITFGFAWDGLNTQFVNLSGGCRREYHSVSQFGKELEPERIILIHIQYTWNTNGTTGCLFFS